MVMSDVPNGKALARCYLIKHNNIYSLNQRICAFRDYSQNPIFLLFLLNRNKYYLRFDDGNGQTNLRKNDVLGCPIILPPLTLQQQFADKISAIEAQKELVKQCIAETQALLDYTMDKYFG
jgi:type I restriction enzyme S subunit